MPVRQANKYRLYKVDAQAIIKCVELYGRLKKYETSIDYDKISEGIGTKTRKAREAIKAAGELKLLDISDKFVPASHDEQRLLFRKALQSFEPFIDFIMFLEKGNDPYEAARKVRSIFGVERNTEDVLWVLREWGSFAGILSEDNYKLIDEFKALKQSSVSKLLLEVDNELRAKLYLRKILGDAIKHLTDEENSLIKAILNIQKDPRTSIQTAGEALEDYLREIAKIRDVDVSKQNGILQIAEALRKSGVIAGKHVQVLKGLQVFLDRDIFEEFSAFRNMAHHGKDKKEMRKWELSEELALSYIIQVLLCIKSLYYYVVEDKLVF